MYQIGKQVYALSTDKGRKVSIEDYFAKQPEMDGYKSNEIVNMLDEGESMVDHQIECELKYLILSSMYLLIQKHFGQSEIAKRSLHC